jgi:predicted DNA-binding ribbon-helix-helix protein
MSNEYLRKRSFRIGHVRTSVALEQEFWSALEEMVRSQWAPNLTQLISDIEMRRDPKQPLASALRVFVLMSGNT